MKKLIPFRLILFVAVLILSGAFTLSTSYAAGPGDDIIYGYYGVRGQANNMSIVQTTTTCSIPLPAGKQVFTYTPVPEPVVSCNPATSKPLGVGDIAQNGNTVEIGADIGPFDKPVDVSFGIFSATFDATDIFFLNVYNQITSLQDEIASSSGATDVAVQGGPGGTKGKKKFNKLIPWKTNVLGVNETIAGPIDVSAFPPGLYVLVLNVTRTSPADDNSDRFYRWVTYFIIPDSVQ